MKTRLAFASALVLGLPLAGCSFHLGSSTDGQQGKATFAYVGLDGCFFGCDTSRPLMTGTHETISIDGDALVAGLTASSDGASVAVSGLTASACCETKSGTSCGGADPAPACAGKLTFSYAVDVDAAGAGAANLVLRTPDGQLFDSLPLQVTAPSRLAFHCPPSGSAPGPELTELSLSGTCSFEIDAFTAAGDPLQASTGYTITAADPERVEVLPDFFLDLGGPPPVVHDAHGSLRAHGHGSTTLSIQAGPAATAVTITVP